MTGTENSINNKDFSRIFFTVFHNVYNFFEKYLKKQTNQ